MKISNELPSRTAFQLTMKLLVLAALAVVAFAQPLEFTDADFQEWESFKVEFNKKYLSAEEHDRRKIIFLNRLKKFQDHNAKFYRDEVSYEVGVNQFTDWTTRERKDYLKVRLPTTEKTSVSMFDMPEGVDLPKFVDWRKKGAVTAVGDQGYCGSCWAFSAVGSLEGQYFVKNKKLVAFSVQNLVDCSGDEGTHGCAGGWPDFAYDYIVKNDGIDTWAAYPYAGVFHNCSYTVAGKGTTIKGSADVEHGNEKKLQQAVAKKGPISVCIDADYEGFMDYKSGVFDEEDCKKEKEDLNHCMTLVGYGTQKKGGDYWLVKNSWKTEWGDQGYVKMSRNKDNQCGIATQAQYPVL